MQVDLDLTGRRVLIVGNSRESRRVLARYFASGATLWQLPHSSEPVAAFTRPVARPSSSIGWNELLASVDIVVVVGTEASADHDLIEACAVCRTWLIHEPAAPTTAVGHVTLVGGGPGDEGLMTVAGRDALMNADVVFFDRLGPHLRLDEWSPGARHVDVGKTPGHHAIPQEEIERMLVEAAQAGDTVVRLKGGDPFVFGRGGEEVMACRKAGVPVSVISGVTSAIAVPGMAGIPVTHREVSKLFTVVSGHVPLSESELAHLVGLGGTIVVLMGMNNLHHLSAGLARHGMPVDMPIAIIERAFSPSQRTTVASLKTVVHAATKANAKSPAVLVIGEVVGLNLYSADVDSGSSAAFARTITTE